MNFEKFTEKSLFAIEDAKKIALENGNQQITEGHILSALLSDNDGLIPEVLAGGDNAIDLVSLKAEVDKIIGTYPKISNVNGLYLSGSLENVFTEAENKAKEMKDDFISVEHIFYAIIDKGDAKIKNLLNKFGVTKDNFL